jgi:hypothetical protein
MTHATRLGCGIIPYVGGLLVLTVPRLFYIWLLMEILEIEVGEAVAVGLVTFVVKLFAALILIRAMS